MNSFLESENYNFQKQRYALFKMAYNNVNFSDIIKSSFPFYHNYKGYGRIVVSSNESVLQAKKLLINHLSFSESYFDEIYPKSLIISFDSEQMNYDFSLVELGKFEIVNLNAFLSLLFEAGILVNYSFS